MIFDLKKFTTIFTEIYGKDNDILKKQFQRYEKLLNRFQDVFNKNDLHFFSTPGRIEIGGNHTDHNHGRVLASSINLDSIAVVAKTDSNIITIYSEGYLEPFVVDLGHLEKVKTEKGTTTALIRGIAARFKQLGFRISGFNAAITSDVLPGSGLSSSASIEVLIGTIFNYLFNDGNVTSQEVAIIGQYAENEYFDKPCGLMDQMTCAVGGIVTIDFKDPQKPIVKKINFDFSSEDFRLLVVNTGGNHEDLSDDYASIPKEMKSVAGHFGADVCREISWKQLTSAFQELRTKVHDRSILRAFHFLGENARVLNQVDTLEKGDFKSFLSLINDSGNSSFKWLQNIYTVQNVHEQGVSLALAVTEKYISDIQAGACRVHGGGFAGTILVFLPTSAVSDYIELMDSIFGADKVLVLDIRMMGTVYLNYFL